MKRRVTTDALMQPIAHFSHAVRVDEVVHVGATAGTDATRRLVGATSGIGDLGAQLQQMCANIDTALALAGSAHEDIVRIKTYVTDVRDFDACAAAIRGWLGSLDACEVLAGSFGFPLPHALVEADVVAIARRHARDATRAAASAPVHLAAAPSVARDGCLPRDAVVQSRLALDALERALAVRGLQRTDLVSLHATLADLRIADAYAAAGEAWLPGVAVASTVVVAPVPGDGVLVQLEAVAVPGGGRPVVPAGTSGDARGLVPAVRAGEHLYIGGQLGARDDGTYPEHVQAQADLAWHRIEATLAAEGLDADAVLRTNVVLADWRLYRDFNAGYGAHVRPPYPPRATMHGVLAHPAALVQIEAIAHARGAQALVVDAASPQGAAGNAGR